MAEKSKMKCNRVTASDRPGKKKMVKAGKGGSTKSSPTNRRGKY